MDTHTLHNATADDMRKAAVRALGTNDAYSIASKSYQAALDRNYTQAQHKRLNTLRGVTFYMLQNNH